MPKSFACLAIMPSTSSSLAIGPSYTTRTSGACGSTLAKSSTSKARPNALVPYVRNSIRSPGIFECTSVSGLLAFLFHDVIGLRPFSCEGHPRTAICSLLRKRLPAVPFDV